MGLAPFFCTFAAKYLTTMKLTPHLTLSLTKIQGQSCGISLLSKVISILLFTLFHTGSITAQNITFFTSKQGLVNSCVQILYEDSRHHIWVGTRNGLNRYDGVKMNTYRHSDADPNSLMNNNVTCVLEYDPAHVLIGTADGIQSYNYATNQFSPVPFITTDNDTTQVYVSSICRLSGDKVVACLAGHGSGLIKKDAKGRLYAQQETIYATNNTSPAQIFEDKDKNLWIINNEHHLYLKTPQGEKKIDVPEMPRNFCLSTSGKLYLGCEGAGLLVYNKQAGRFEPISDGESDYNLCTIRPWTNGRIFICTDGHGLKVYDEHTGKITQSNIQTNDFNLATSNVKDALSDVYGNVWVGVYWRGVMMKPINQSTFEYIGRNSITKNSIGINPVTAIAPSHDKKLWVATDHNGIYKISDNGTNSQHWNPAEVKYMPSTVNTLTEDADGTLWLGGYTDGLWSMNTQTGTFTRSHYNINRVFDITTDNTSDDIWIATLGMGFYRYNPHTDALVHYTNHSGNIQAASFLDPNLFAFCILPWKNILYVGTSNGLEVYQKDKEPLVPQKRFLTHFNILCMKLDQKKEYLWIGTTNGLHRLHIKTDSIKSYTEADGLPNSVVNSMEMQADNIWLGTGNGLSCFNTHRETFTNFWGEDGLQDNEFGNCASASANGYLYFGGIGGITYFHQNNIDNLKKATTSFKIQLVDFYLNNKAVHRGDKSGSYEILDNYIDETSMVNLASNDNRFSIEIAAPEAKNRHITYEYSFDGNNWQTQEGNTGHIIIQGLTPGLYHLKIRARSYQALSEERTLTITVHHPWYTSPLALLIYLALGILALWGLIHVIRRQVTARRVLMRHRQEREINEARIQFFMNISHEIRTPMTLIMAPLEKLMSMDRDEPHQRNYHLIHQNAKRILRLVNQLMDVRKIEKGQYRLEYTAIDIIPFIQNTCDVFSTVATQRTIDFQFLHDTDSLHVKTDPDNLDKILMNLLSNAFKFTPDGGTITLKLEADRNYLTFLVSDTGSGISDADKTKIFERFYSAEHQNGYLGTGIGLNLTYLLVGLFKGTITVADNPAGQGTTFTIQLPYIAAKVKNEELMDTEEQEEEVTSSHTPFVELPIEKLRGVKHRNVLIVEDDPAIRQYLHSELSHDMILTECANGAEGWEYIQKNPDKVNLVISDRMMPQMDGLTLCQRIKQNPLTSHIPVILITALGSDADRIDGLQGGADAYVSKPFNIDVLRTTAINLMQSRLLLQGKYSTEQKTEEKLEKVEITSPDEHLMERVMRAINQNMDNPDLSVEMFADIVGISRVHFYRKIKELTGQSPRDFLKTIRLKEAARLLREKHLDITSVSDATGFKTLSTFSTSFKALYGMTPSEYQNANIKTEK